MADDSQTLRNINWRQLFPFTHLFRSFRVAIHPSKLVLGLMLVLALYFGGRVLDAVWYSGYYPSYAEIDKFTASRWNHDVGATFDSVRDQDRQQNADQYARLLKQQGLVADDQLALDAARRGKYFRQLEKHVVSERNQRILDAKAAFDTAQTAANAVTNERDRSTRRRELTDERESRIRQAEVEALATLEMLTRIAPRPIFDEFFNYEARQFHNVIDSALSGNWLNGVATSGASEATAFTRGRAVLNDVSAGSVYSGPVSVVQSISNFVAVGPGWMLRYHFGFFILYAAWYLLVWAVFGGAIARIAAVHVARDEKISVRQALRFSTNKVLSFVFAPIIPLIIILALGAVVAVGGTLLYIPVIGPIVIGALFFLALLAGFVMTLVVAGTAGGFNLMYPTIAVEGSDSFDAISRSFSYVFAMPWRMVFYTAVALVYGALTFVFCRMFVYVMLSLTHFFVGWFLRGQAAQYRPQIWPPVNDGNLTYNLLFPALAWSEQVAAVLISIWVYLLLALLGGFVISFYFSSNTIIYFLVRREVDATEMDDVYLEETEDDFGDTASAGSAPKVETVTTDTTTTSIITTPDVGPASAGAGQLFPSKRAEATKTRRREGRREEDNFETEDGRQKVQLYLFSSRLPSRSLRRRGPI